MMFDCFNQFCRSALILTALTALGCAAASRPPERYDRYILDKTLDEYEKTGTTTTADASLVLGEFALKKVVDGDTLWVEGLDKSLRLLAIDTEETFKKETERRAFEEGWETYLAKSQIERRGKPVKIPTPVGEEAKDYAKHFFEGVRTVRLERDHPKEIRGRFDRHLVYVFAEKSDQWVNYNVECVRAGMSPYFTKYSYSRRFHQEFVDAQNEARAAKRGIWDPNKQHYHDYDTRIAWWNRRADYIAAFEREAADDDSMITLTHWDALDRIGQRLQREVTVLATVGDIRYGKGRAPTRVLLSRRMFQDFPLIFFDRDTLKASKVEDSRGDFVRVRGVVTTYHNKRTDEDVLQIMVEKPGQIIRDPDQGPPRILPGHPDWPFAIPDGYEPESEDNRDDLIAPAEDNSPNSESTEDGAPATAVPDPQPATDPPTAPTSDPTIADPPTPTAP